jgi:uncharacterized membrane protein YkvA (DUF1232 family)
MVRWFGNSDKTTSAAMSAVKQGADYLQKNPDALKRILSEFPGKLSESSGKITFATQATAMYYALRDPKTPLKVKALIGAALAYFIMPFDLIPDWIVGLGFTDDLAVVMMVLRQLAGSITPEHYELARRRLQREK